MTGRIGIIGAMSEEVNLLLSDIVELQKQTIGQIDFYLGEIENKTENKPVVLAICGIGKVNAAICATLMVQVFGATKIIFTGVAGSLHHEIKINDAVIGETLIQHDFDTSFFGDKRGVISRMKESTFASDKALMSLADSALSHHLGEHNVHRGLIVSGDQFVSSSAQKEHLSSYFGALCVEMEGAAVAHACYLLDIPFVIIRYISDNADEGAVVDFATFVSATAHTSRRVVLDIISNIND